MNSESPAPPKSGLIVRHVPHEGLAGYRTPIEAAGFELDRIDVCGPEFAHADFLSPDLLILMGGPMGVYEQSAYPWLAREIERIAERLELGLPTLGICLGAQLVAAALGAEIYAGPVKEIGFSPLTLTEAGRASPVAHLEDVPVLHWHGDTFDLPPGTELLASTRDYPNQIFRRGTSLLALQCHAEMGVDPRIDAWIADSGDYLSEAGICPRALRSEYDETGPHSERAGQKMIAEWLTQLAA
ncbi:MAG: glutamine amidotransferase [Sphingomonadales bacterium]|nr:glutamine amidotransferase [Sphingomonadales bacterium]